MPTPASPLTRAFSSFWLARAASLLVSLLAGLALAGAWLLIVQRPPAALAQPVHSPAALSYPGAFPCDTTLQACINGTITGETINIAPNVYVTSFTLNKAVSLVGAGAGSTVFQALPGQRVLTVSAPMSGSTQIAGMTLESGSAGAGLGGGILLLAGARPLLQNLVVLANSAASGGGIYATSGITLSGVTLSANQATNGSGGGLFSNGDVYAANAVFQNNTVITNGYGGGVFAGANFTGNNVNFSANAINHGYDGGGLYTAAALTLNGGQFVNNRTDQYKGYGGGGGLIAFGLVSISGTQFLSNTTADWGGGAYVAYFANTQASVLTNVSFISNTAATGGGGGLFMWFASTLTAVDFFSNVAGFRGGGAYAGYSGNFPTFIQGGTMANNTAQGGGGLYSDSSITLTGTQFLSNTALNGNGGGAWTPLSAIVSGAYFTDNTAVLGNGGAAFAQGTVTLDHAVFAGNQAGGVGGALAVSSTLAISASQMVGNFALSGGGVYQSGGDGRIVNSLFARNSALSKAGMQLYLAPTGTVQILFTTVGASSLVTGDAILVAGGTVQLQDSIITNHAIGLHRQAGTVSQDYNLFFGNLVDKSGAAISGGANNASGDPRFANPAADDYHLQSGSAAIDVGLNLGVATDYDGQPRPLGAGFDLGYDEYKPVLFLPLVMK